MRKRVFIGCPIDSLKMVIHHFVCNHLTDPLCKIVPERNLHLTYYFAGMVEDDILPIIYYKIEQLSEQQEVIYLQSKSFTKIKKHKQGMFWLEFMGSEEFNRLALLSREAFNVTANPIPLHPECRPHITLARFKDDANIHWQKDIDFTDAHLALTHINIYESKSGTHHVEYSLLKSFPFKGGQA
ncbi:MAG TPA: hypothetical protein PKH65_10125 [Bacteroidia bacterium]|nr:hypothetical protein [Bacteroidia bacterium]HNT81027.1 hypothetical protein [Bacteroidia bacterium]